MENKKNRARAIIFKDNKIVAMYRERENRVFYSFPGGGAEEGETLQECVVREVFEEFGLTVEPIKQVYIYESQYNIEHFFICRWIGGEFGSGTGEEFESTNTNGIYIPSLIDIDKIPNLPLMPPEIAKEFVIDYATNKEELTNTIKHLYRQD